MAMERSVLYRTMQSIRQMSPSEYIKEVRVNVAATLLADNPDMAISEISDKTGFSNPKYFSKVFKSHFGMSPSDYRHSPDKK